ncbi:hypothetical protein C1H46_045433 [Malus baccata]|uniref:Uncharacterized protein n=1 Tax=Malus baccata TaxID=106549 RepID=A0A540K488_MALBA|nr:hypothetical protein C1H46_045433 [Malus baccata]
MKTSSLYARSAGPCQGTKVAERKESVPELAYPQIFDSVSDIKTFIGLLLDLRLGL